MNDEYPSYETEKSTYNGGSPSPSLTSEEYGIALLKESRECIAACFRTIATSDDQMIMDRLEMQLALAGVKDGIGMRLQNFIKASTEKVSRRSDGEAGKHREKMK